MRSRCTPIGRLCALAVAGALALGLGCGDGDAGQTVQRDLRLRTLMMRMEGERLIMESNLRNPDALATHLARGRKMREAVRDEAFLNYPAHPDMAGKDGELFLEYRERLVVAVDAFVAAAEAGDLEGIYEPYTQLNASCTTCHKRFDPTY